MSVFIPTGGSGGASDYLEYGWVCAPNAAGQSITANTITTLTIDTEVADTGNHGSISSNQITLAAGTYYFEAEISQSAESRNAILGLYNTSDSVWVTRRHSSNSGAGYAIMLDLLGQFTIDSSKTFELRYADSASSTIGDIGTDFTLSTAGADQRTTIKLWKLA